jgi:NitT/TauT family transport system substrate-binding protein
MRRLLLLLLLAGASLPAQAAEAVTIGVVPVISAAATYMAVEKGYFREAGIEAQLENVDSGSTAVAMLATNRLQVVEGGLSIGYFNALAEGMPIIIALERGSSPLGHDLVLRRGLDAEVKKVADLRGRSIALVAPGSIAVYEVGKVLETGGLTLKDVEVKYIPFPQVGIALQNGAIDAANTVPPWGAFAIDNGFATRWIDTDDYIRPSPVVISIYMANTDWAAQHRDLALRIFTAIVRGARDYCQAYHHGSIRGEVMDVLMRYGAFKDRASLDRMVWQARDPDGRINVASVEDLQDWFFKQGLIPQKFPTARLIDTSYAEAIATALPAFEVENKDSKLGGCR